MRFLGILSVLLLLWSPVKAQDNTITQADVDEVAHMLDATMTGSGDYALVEQQGRTFYTYVVDQFGAESRQALQVEWLLVMAVALQGRVDEAQGLADQMIAKAQRLLSVDDPLAYKCVAAAAAALRASGREDEALSLLAESVDLAERWLPETALEIDELRLVQAQFAASKGDAALAEAAYRRLDERLATRTEPNAMALHALGMVGWARLQAEYGDPEVALPFYDRALAAIDAQFGDLKHPRMQPVRLATVALKAEALETTGRGDQVPALLRPLMAEVAAHYGEDSPLWADLAVFLSISLAGDEVGGPGEDEALMLMSRVVDIRERVLDPDSAELVRARMNLAVLLAANGQARQAVAQFRAMNGAALPGWRLQVVYVLRTAQESGALTADEAVDAMLAWMQDSQRSGAAAAQRLLTARLAAGSDAVADLLRRRSDIDGQLDDLRSRLAAQTSLPLDQRDDALVLDLRDRIGILIGQWNEVAQKLSDTPAAAATGNDRLTLAQIRARLNPDSAVVLIESPTDPGDPGLIVAVSDTAVDWHTFQVEGPEVAAAVQSLRAGIDLRLGVRAAVPMGNAPAPAALDLGAAHWLYRQTLAQVDTVIGGKAHLWFDLRGPMSALPPQMMLVSPPASDDPAQADWLIRHHAVTILPALSALPSAGASSEPGAGFLAFADARFGALEQSAPAVLRNSLSPLPETAGEVRAVAASLGQGADTLRLGPAATEGAVKATALSGIGTLYFATHGLVGGDQVGEGALAEAALALTPGDGEDGFLTASEIIGLHLNARIVVLSACNTATGGVAGAEALSGLAQAFLYAGARALLVSHWPVESRSAARLMTDTFAALSADRGIGMARAHQQAILSMIDTPADPRWSHPAYWAPFVLVGNPD